jgi:hypothetical protein
MSGFGVHMCLANKGKMGVSIAADICNEEV